MHLSHRFGEGLLADARYISICLLAERGYFSRVQKYQPKLQRSHFFPSCPLLPVPASKMTLPPFTSFPRQQKETTDSLPRNLSSAEEEEKGDWHQKCTSRGKRNSYATKTSPGKRQKPETGVSKTCPDKASFCTSSSWTSCWSQSSCFFNFSLLRNLLGSAITPLPQHTSENRNSDIRATSR